MSRAQGCAGETATLYLTYKLFVMPGFDYMDVVGRAMQEAKAETRHPVNNCFYWIRVASDSMSSRDITTSCRLHSPE